MYCGTPRSPKTYAPRQMLRNLGDPATHLLLLLSGRVAATVTASSGRVVRFGDFAAPCALDKVAVIDGGGHTATFTALTPCVMRNLPRGRFLVLLDGVVAARDHVLRTLAEIARQQQARLAAAATSRAQACLAAWLLVEARAAAGGAVTLPGTQESLADLLGGRESDDQAGAGGAAPGRSYRGAIGKDRYPRPGIARAPRQRLTLCLLAGRPVSRERHPQSIRRSHSANRNDRFPKAGDRRAAEVLRRSVTVAYILASLARFSESDDGCAMAIAAGEESVQ